MKIAIQILFYSLIIVGPMRHDQQIEGTKQILLGFISEIWFSDEVEAEEFIKKCIDLNELHQQIIHTASLIQGQFENQQQEGLKIIAYQITEIQEKLNLWETYGQQLETGNIIHNHKQFNQHSIKEVLQQIQKKEYPNNCLLDQQCYRYKKDLNYEMQNFLQYWSQNKFQYIGYEIGVILKILGKEKQRKIILAQPRELLKDVFVGLLVGIAEANGAILKDISRCFSSVENIVIDFDNAIDLLESGEFDKMFEGLKLIGKSLWIFPKAIKQCYKSLSVDIAQLVLKIERLIQILEFPASFAFEIGKNFLVNGVDIIDEVTKAIDDWNENHWENFGVQIGQAIYHVALGQEQRSSSSPCLKVWFYLK